MNWALCGSSRGLSRDSSPCSSCTLRPDPHERLNLYSSRLSNELPLTRDVVTPDLGRRNRSVSPFSWAAEYVLGNGRKNESTRLWPLRRLRSGCQDRPVDLPRVRGPVRYSWRRSLCAVPKGNVSGPSCAAATPEGSISDPREARGSVCSASTTRSGRMSVSRSHGSGGRPLPNNSLKRPPCRGRFSPARAVTANVPVCLGISSGRAPLSSSVRRNRGVPEEGEVSRAEGKGPVSFGTSGPSSRC